ncbi:hypothetical protein CL656_06230 [bacterium]|nr:hypothetical protein [bacterium]|tara:strand:- start:438 stop:905 length:468 start_codon:yes stop_codon:yes gene_type:complete
MNNNKIKIYINNDEYYKRVIKYLDNNNIHNNYNYQNIYYTTKGLIKNNNNVLKKMKLFEDDNLVNILNKILSKKQIGNNLLIDCSYYKENENIYNLPNECYEVKLEQNIYYINECINMILEKESYNNKIINESYYFQLLNKNLEYNMRVISEIIE